MENTNENKIPMSEKVGIPTLNKETSGHKKAETYAEDMAKTIAGDKEGLIKKILQEEEMHEVEKKNLSPESRKNQILMFFSISLVVATLAIFYFFLFKKDINTVEVKEPFTPLVFNDASDFIEVLGFNKDKIAQNVYSVAKSTNVKGGGVEGIYLTENKEVVGFTRFIALIKGSFLEVGIFSNRNSVNEHFLMGAVNNENLPSGVSGSKDFFILLQVRSITDVFESMHAWESKMFFDLHGFFGINISSGTSYLLTKNFEDSIVENKNARVLYDNNGEIAMMYIFADDTSIIITNTKNAAREIILRLAGGQIKK